MYSWIWFFITENMETPIFKTLPIVANPTLLLQNIFDQIPENHPVRLVNRVVDELNIDGLLAKYKGGGTSSFEPRMMLKVLFYSYLSNIYSCRKIEKALQENIHFMWLSGLSTPDYRTINYFRGHRLKGIIHVFFVQIVKLFQELNLISMRIQYIDGTKIEAATHKYSFVWRGSVEKNKAKLEEKINHILTQIENAIQQDSASQEENQPKISSKFDSTTLKEKLAELTKNLPSIPKKIQPQFNELSKKSLPKLAEYEQKLNTLDKRNSYSKTDTDATFMRMKEDVMKNGQLKPAYNVQISTEGQFITHYTICQNPGDSTTLIPHLEGFMENYEQKIEKVVTDAGYGSLENYTYLEEKKIEAHVKYNTFAIEQKTKNKSISDSLFYNKEEDYFTCHAGEKLEKVAERERNSSNGFPYLVCIYQAKNCQNCPFRENCFKGDGNRSIEINHELKRLREKAKRLLTSQEGIYHRKKRCIEPEAVFGQLKSNNKFNRFTFRGKEKVSLEFSLMSIGHNLRKLAVKNAQKVA